jgi:hypothetical protein
MPPQGGARAHEITRGQRIAHFPHRGDEPAEREAALEEPGLDEKAERPRQPSRRGLSGRARQVRDGCHDNDEGHPGGHEEARRQMLGGAPSGGDQRADPRDGMEAAGRISQSQVEHDGEEQYGHAI